MDDVTRTIVLCSEHGATYEVTVVGVQHHPDGLIVRWGFQNYTLSLQINRLVRIEGNRLKKRYIWRARDLEEAQRIFDEEIAKKSTKM